MFVGVDGCAAGWVAVAIDDRFRAATVDATFEGVIARHPNARVIGVDMPIGLTEAEAREADGAARAFLRGQASSVFSAPPRPVLEATDYGEACAIAARLTGKRMSKQSFHLFAKIREVDAFVDDPRLHEVHPEIAFRLLAGARIPWGKKTYGGVRRRLALLRKAGLRLPEDLGEASRVGVDDVLDAAAAVWSARRIARGEARSFPAAPTQRDRSGRRLAIWG